LQVDTTGTVTPTASSTKQIDELKATVTAQDNTISTLQAQFANLRTNQEAHIDSLTKTHNAEVTSLKEYTRVLEEQLAHRPLHHGEYLPFTSRFPPTQSENVTAPVQPLTANDTVVLRHKSSP
jgi:hypothetical protein